MGVDRHVLRFLLEARRKGVSFAQTMMIGRQSLDLPPAELQAMLRANGLSLTEAEVAEIYQQRGRFIEPLLHLLGAGRIESVDASSYEQATVVHDLNLPIPERLKGAFSCVLDGGSLEHVFNFPQAIKNCMEMVAEGGHFLGVAPANNWMGHGFYQFSPELYYRVFSERNGYAAEAMMVCETCAGAPWYSVADPEQLGRRVEWVNRRPTYLLVQARRLSRADIFQDPPQQSDYAAQWSIGIPTQPSLPPPRSFPALRRLAPEPIKKLLRPLLAWRRLGKPDNQAFRKL